MKTMRDFRKLVYEPEHSETVCWCNPKFENREGTLHIIHNEQRDTLTNYITDLVQDKQDELQKAYAEALAEGDHETSNTYAFAIAMLNNMFLPPLTNKQ